MARPLRIDYEGAYHHIIARGNRGENIFQSPEDKNFLLYKLTECKNNIYDFECLGFCIMDNHFHLFNITKKAFMSKILHLIETSYAMYYNKKYKKSGHVFQGRYQDIIVDSNEYLLELSRYIHLNPVKAGIVSSPELYPWSSCKIYFDFHTNSSLINKKIILEQFSNNIKDASSLYKKFLLDGIRKDWKPIPTKAKNYLFLGNNVFITNILKKFDYDDRKINNRKIEKISANLVISFISKKYHLNNLILKGKHKKSSKIRKELIYLLRTMSHLKIEKIAEILNIGKSSVTRNYNQIIEEFQNINYKNNLIMEFNQWLESGKRKV